MATKLIPTRTTTPTTTVSAVSIADVKDWRVDVLTGSYYYSNSDGSSYYNNGSGGASYNAPSGKKRAANGSLVSYLREALAACERL